jgi:NADPH-dependent ferric siderophore reductase
MDGRRNNGGHSTKGFAGRPTKADEIKIIEQMDAIAVPEDAWRALWVKCQDGDIQAIKCWLNYRFGMPKQVVDVTTQGEKVTPPIEWLTSK